MEKANSSRPRIGRRKGEVSRTIVDHDLGTEDVGEEAFAVSTDIYRLTWSQVGDDTTKAALEDCLKVIRKFSRKYPFSYMIGLEDHEDGGKHVHAYVRYEKRKRTENLQKALMFYGKNPCFSWRMTPGYAAKDGVYITNMHEIEYLRPLEFFKVRYADLWGWQKEACKLFTEPAPMDNRTVHWWFEREGKYGKTKMAKFLYDSCGAFYVGGRTADIMCALAKRVAKRGYPPIVVVDLPRCARPNYSKLELLLSGIGFNGKYETDELRWPPVHLIVLSNDEPESTLLSADRWQIRNVRDFKTVIPPTIALTCEETPPTGGSPPPAGGKFF